MFLGLHAIRGYQHREIAELLQCSIGNSKSQLHTAKLKMRRLLFPKWSAALLPKAVGVTEGTTNRGA
jgi:RNA polymerase sigma-70 factor (ECF subfamily)